MVTLKQLSKTIPYSYLWTHARCIRNIQKGSMLDLGCGGGSFTYHMLGDDSKIKVTGIDLYNHDLLRAKQLDFYKELIKGDITKHVMKFKDQHRKFDIIFCSQVIEHLSRNKGEKLLSVLPQLAKKKIIIGTPLGFMNQPIKKEKNILQMHHSGWSIEDFTSRGYKVYGTGLKLAWSENGLARSKNRIISILFTLISLGASPLVYYFPRFGSGIVAVKNV